MYPHGTVGASVRGWYVILGDRPRPQVQHSPLPPLGFTNHSGLLLYITNTGSLYGGEVR